MKQFWKKFVKRVSQIRDYVIMALIAVGILYAMQTTQAVESQEPGETWRGKYSDQVRGPGDLGGGGMPVPGMPGMPGAPGAPGVPGAPGAVAPPTGGGDITSGNIDFTPLSPNEIGPISYHPIFTPASNFSNLLESLKKLQADYRAAIQAGNLPLAIEKLTQYVKDDPKGTLLEWPTPPEELLQNHICSEISRSISEASKQGQTALDEAAQPGGDLLQSIESLDSTLTLLERTVQESQAHPSCLEGTDVTPGQVTALQDTRDKLLQSREDLNKKLVLQSYEEVVQKVSAITAESDPEQVSVAIQSLSQFERILEERNKDYLIQSQFERLKELQSNLEKNKEEIIKRVLQEISRLAAEDATGKSTEGIREILRLYDVLDVLKVPESDISRERRKWESSLSKLEATEGVQEMREKLKEVRASLEKAEEELSGGRVPQDVASTYNDRMAEIQGIQKRTKEIKRIPGYTEVRTEINELQKMYTKIGVRIENLKK